MFTTPGSQRKSVLENAKVFNFRKLNSKYIMLNFRVLDFTGFVIYFSQGVKKHREMPTIEVTLTEVHFGRSSGNKTVIRTLKTLKRETKAKENHDFWILLVGSKIHLGEKTNKFYETFANTEYEELANLNFVGFSSLLKSNWIVENGN